MKVSNNVPERLKINCKQLRNKKIKYKKEIQKNEKEITKEGGTL